MADVPVEQVVKRARLGGDADDALIGTADSASLWNVTLSPGWTIEDSKLLELALAKFGVGRWSKIVKAGVLPGKSVSQLNLQTQRLLGQQATSEFMGLHIYCSRIGQKNALNINAPRKNGCIINDGAKIPPEETRKRKEENRRVYGLTDEQVEAIQLPTPKESNGDATGATEDDSDQRAIVAAERQLLVLVTTRNARAAAKPMPVRGWNGSSSVTTRTTVDEDLTL